MSWTDSDIRQLRAMAKDHSASEIARTLRKTRNAVLGKAHRLGISLQPFYPRPSRKRQPMPKLRVVKEKPAPPVKAKPASPPVMAGPPLNIGVLEVTDRQCRYPTAEPSHREHLMCGHPVRPGSRYCPAHHALSYTGTAWPK